jgi:hypothetical protein
MEETKMTAHTRKNDWAAIRSSYPWRREGHRGRLFNRHFWARLLLVSLSFAVSPWASAQAAPCALIGSPTADRIPFVIDVNSASTYGSTLTDDGFVFAVMLATETWNEQTNGAYFEFEGFYDPDPGDQGFQQICRQRDVNCALGTASARARANCDPRWVYNEMDLYDCTQIPSDGVVFTMVPRAGIGGQRDSISHCSGGKAYVNLTTGSTLDGGSLANWNLNYATDGAPDPAAVLVHEAGHALGLFHSPSNVSVMSSANLRDPLQWDRKCVDQIGRRTDVVGKRHWTYSSPWTFQGEHSFTSAGFTGGGPGVWYSAPDDEWYWSSTANHQTDAFWNDGITDFSTSNTEVVGWSSINWLTSSSQNPRTYVWRESDSRDEYVVYSSQATWDDDNGNGRQESEDAVSRMRYVRSSDQFRTSSSRGYLKHCDDEQRGRCYSSSFIHSARPMVLTYADRLGVSAALWVNQEPRDRAKNEDRNRLKVATKLLRPGLLGQTSDLGVRSSVLPGFSCAASTYGSQDCVVAYVSSNPGDAGTISIVQFDLEADADGSISVTNETSSAAAGSVSNVRTASQMTMWSMGGLYFLGVKEYENENGYVVDPEVSIHVSAGGRYWYRWKQSIGPSIVGPVAVPYWHGANAVVRWESE